MDKYFCKLCNLNYKSRTGLWKHNKNYHDNIKKNHNENNQKSTNVCIYCEKVLSDRQSRWRHEKICKKKNNIEEINKVKEEFNDKIQKLESQIEVIKNKPSNITNIKNINNGTINKGPVYNFLTKPGEENINILTEKEMEQIIEQEMNCLVYLVEHLNFNEKHPENHSFCTTALNDKYISTMNTETLTIEKKRKKDFFDTMLNASLKNIRFLYDRLKNKKTPKLIKFKETMDNLTEYIVVNNKGKKAYVEMMNTLTFNKRHLTQATWLQLLNNQLPNKTESNNESNENSSNDSDSDSDSETSNNFDTESYEENSENSDSEELPEIKIQGKKYLLDGDKLYSINLLGLKDKLEGKLFNGKLVKIKPKDIEV